MEPVESVESGERTRRKFLMLEVLAVMGTRIVGIVSGFFSPMRSKDSLPNWLLEYQSYSAPFAIPRGLAWLGLLLFILYASGDKLSLFGLRKLRWGRDLTVFAIALFGLGASWYFHGFIHRSSPDQLLMESSYRGGLAGLWVIALLILTTAASIETIFRGYLVPRIEELTGSTILAVLTQAALYSLSLWPDTWHEIVFGGLNALFLGLLFVRWRSVWPLIAAHAIFQFAAIYLSIQAIPQY
jgi:membrane protease YdiL (CAAX protease family)